MDKMSENEKPLFDAEAIYDEQISPLVAQIIKICQENQIPLFLTCLYGRDEDGDNYATTLIPGDDRMPDKFDLHRQVAFSQHSAPLLAYAIRRRQEQEAQK